MEGMTVFESRVLAKLEALQDGHDELREGLKAISRDLNGGDDYTKGIKTRVDRLEQSEESAKKIRNVIGGAAIVSFIGWVWQLLTGTGK